MLTPPMIEKAVALLKANQIVILPTDTIYGLSAKFSPTNQQKINHIKQSVEDKPLIILFSQLTQVADWVDIDPQVWKLLQEKTPITVIFSSKKNPQQTFALRLIKRPDVQMIIDQVGPIYSTSVNDHNESPLNDFQSLKNFNSHIQVFFDQIANGRPSKIYDSRTKKWVR